MVMPDHNIVLADYVSSNNSQRTLFIRGLQFKIKIEEIIEFFKGYGKLTTDDIYIEQSGLKRTGGALVIMENLELAQEAKKNLDRKFIEERYIEIYDDKHPLMIEICRLNN